MASGIRLPVLGELMSRELEYGTQVLVEFDPDSPWYELSLTMAAQALKAGVRTEYHLMQHLPRLVKGALEKLGVNLRASEGSGSLRIIDWYTPQTGLPGKENWNWQSWTNSPSFAVKDFVKTTKAQLAEGVPEREKKWLHIDDNASILLQYNDEEEYLDFYRTLFTSQVKAREVVMVTAFPRGIASVKFYNKLEAMCDCLIDLKTEEESGKIEHHARARVAHGSTLDSTWHRLAVKGTGEVVFSGPRRGMEIRFAGKAESAIFDYLARSFIDDYMQKRFPLERAGWRSLVEISRATRMPTSRLYAHGGGISDLFNEQMRRGLVEARTFPGERGRGGKVTRLRVAYDKDPVKEAVNQKIISSPKKTSEDDLRHSSLE